MNEPKLLEKRLLQIIHFMNEKFKNHAILKGGMTLRLLNSPRYTQDLDYVFSPKVSRKVIAKQFKKLTEETPELSITKESLNSRGVFIDLDWQGTFIQIEISIVKELHCPPDVQSTAVLASQFQMPAQIISTLAKEEAYSHKIAASIERNVMRDLFDISIYEPMTPFDKNTLKDRLAKISIHRRKPIALSPQKAAAILKEKAERLNQENLEASLSGMIPKTILAGGSDRIKASLLRLCQQLEHTNL